MRDELYMQVQERPLRKLLLYAFLRGGSAAFNDGGALGADGRCVVGRGSRRGFAADLASGRLDARRRPPALLALRAPIGGPRGISVILTP